MADTKNPPIIVETDGVNEIEIGSKATLSVVKVGEKKSLSVAKTATDNDPVKWVWIAAEYLEQAKKMEPGQVFDKWGEWRTKNADKPINKYGIGKQYVKANAVGTKTSKKELNEGTIYYFEPFINYPTLDRGNYIATVDKPKILSAYFARYKDEFKYPGESGKSSTFTYKNTIKLYVLGHMLPDYTLGYHNFASFEVDIWDKEGNKVTKEPLKYYQKYHAGKFSVNTMTELDFVIDEAWRDESKHKKDTVKTYYAKIKTTLYSNEDAFTGEEVDKINDKHLITANENPRNNHRYLKFTNKFKSVAPNLDTIGLVYTDEDEAVSQSGWFGRNVDKGKANAKKYTKKSLEEYDTSKGTVLKDQQVSFDVKYDTMDVILDNYEAAKNNMLVVVGDVEYTSKNTDPCKFSSIEISHKSRKDPFVLFDENTPTPAPIDQTNLVFGIVAGDKKEKVTITAKGLAIQNYQDKGLKKPVCYGITTAHKSRKGRLERKKVKHKKEDEFKHNSIEDVFNMKKAYVLYPDRLSPTTNLNQETTGSETIDISGQDIKYTHKDNNVEIEIGYLYNKNYDNRVLNFLAYDASYLKSSQFVEALKNIWVVRYLYKVAIGESVTQSYFIPISTCRYPNQVARIAVYPDMKWVVNLNYNIKEPLYYNETPTQMEYHNLADNEFADMSGNIRRKREASTAKHISTAYQNQKSAFGIYVECEVDGSSKIKLGKDFAEKFRKMLAPLTWISSFMDDKLAASDAKAEQEKLKLNTGKKGLLARLNKLPMSFEIIAPNIGVGLGIGYGETQGHAVGYELEGRLLMNPIIGANVKLDVLALGSKFKPWGAIIDALDIASWLLNFCTNGKAQVNYKIDIVFGAKIKLVGRGSEDGTDKPAELAYNFASKKYAGNIALQGVLEGKVEASLEMIIEVEKESKRSFDSSIKSKKEREKAFEMGVGIEASSYVSLTLGKDFGEKDDFSSDFYFSGISLKVWVKAGFSKGDDKPKIVKIIPDFDKSFDILKNKGEYK